MNLLAGNLTQNTLVFNPGARWLKRVSAVIMVVITFVWYSPYVHSAVTELKKPPVLNRLETFNPLGAELATVKNAMKQWQRAESNAGDPRTAWLERLAGMQKKLEEVADETVEYHHQVLRVMEANKAPDPATNAQKALIRHLERNMSRVFAGLNTLQHEQDEGRWRQALADLALAVSDPVTRPGQSFGNDLDFITPAARQIILEQSQIEALLGVSGDPALPDSAYLATDAATQSTQNILDKVSELGIDPVALYSWVHDHIRWIPSYGVMQGADYTLQSGQGNAFDTASLLISLYRAAGIPARYVYGTVALDAANVNNWIGGVSHTDASANLLSQGGIPYQHIHYGGRIEDTEMEHVWVEARIGGTWKAFDPSFKQYSYTDGVDLATAVPFDGAGLLTQLQQGAVINETEGWVQGMDQSLLESQLNSYNTQLQDYLTANHAEATLAGILGHQQIQPNTATALEEVTLPYLREITRQPVPNLPQSLFYQFTLQLGSVTDDGPGTPRSWGSVIAELNDVTPNLLSKRLAISFKPATAADEQTLASFIPDTVNSPEDLPDRLPASTINLIGEITVDGNPVATTPVMTLGDAVRSRLGYTAPERSWQYSENGLVAGEYHAVGMDMQGISPDQLETLKTDLDTVKGQLEAENTAGLTKHDLVGNILQTGIQGYLAMTYAMDKMAANPGNVVSYRTPSYGTFGTHAQVAYAFGLPSEYIFSGLVMDVDQIQSNNESKDNCYEDWLAFNQASGTRSSAFEHQVPEMMFSTEENPAEAVSTVKALAIAMAQGQRIYTLTQDNAGELANITIDDTARAEIQSAVSQGLTVTVHQAPINVNGWEGSGYAIVDADYGVGAYKISGGSSGAQIVAVVSGILLSMIGVGAITATAFWLFSLILINILSSLITLWTTAECDLGNGIFLNYAAIILFASLPAAGIEAIRVYLMGFFATTGASSGAQLYCEFNL